MQIKKGLILFFLFLLFLFSVFAGVFYGSTGSLSSMGDNVKEIISLRFPRVIVALITGGALAISGAALQSILENPLAEPFLLGVSGGAVLGGTIGIILGNYISESIYGVRLFSFAGAIASVFLLLIISRGRGGLDPVNMLLIGVIFNGFVSALVTLLKAFIPALQLQRVTLWLSGYIPYIRFEEVSIETLAVLLLSLILIFDSGRLNILSLGEEIASTSGVNVKGLRIRVFVITSILTGIVVSMTGLIGFVGLIVPQGLRLMGFVSNRALLPLSFILGGTFLILADLFARIISGIYGFEPPISAITAVFGGPAFVYLLRRYYSLRGGD